MKVKEEREGGRDGRMKREGRPLEEGWDEGEEGKGVVPCFRKAYPVRLYQALKY
jgi:hypothetical protein